MGLVGSVMSTKEVPSLRPTSAYSRPVIGSVQPQLSLARTPRVRPSARRSEGGHVGQQFDLVAVEGTDLPLDAAALLADQGTEHVGCTHEHLAVSPAAGCALEDVDRAGLVVHSRRANSHQISIGDEQAAEPVALDGFFLRELDAARLGWAANRRSRASYTKTEPSS